MAKSRAEILIVDDEELICFVLSNLFKVHGYKTRTAGNGEEALAMISERMPSLIVLDIRMPGLSGIDVLYRVKQMDLRVPVILMTALAGVRDAVQAMKAGAFDYVAKPFNNDDMLRVVARALSSGMSQKQAASPKKDTKEEGLLFSTMGNSPRIRDLAGKIGLVAPGDADILITGDTGTGKRMLARSIHKLSSRSEDAFITLDCTGTEENVLEQELFGLEEPGSTGPALKRKGKLELVGNGTLLIDEFSETSPAFQSKVQNAVSTRRAARVHGNDPVHLACRFVLTSSSDLLSLQQNQAVDQMMLANLADKHLHIPALRDRKEDIPFLSEQFLETSNKELGKKIAGFSSAAIEMLTVYDWPGNVHQLKSTIRRAVLHASEVIGVDDLEIPTLTRFHKRQTSAGIEVNDLALKDQVRKHIAEIERQMILETLQKTGWNKAKASRLLQITYKTMLKKVQEYDLEATSV